MWHCILLALFFLFTSAAQESCRNMHQELKIPCLCTQDSLKQIRINCDHVSFLREFPLLPSSLPIIEFTQRHAYIQELSTQLFAATGLHIKKADFSHNNIQQMSKGTWNGLEDHLEELLLNSNRIGETHDPFLHSLTNLTALKILDLRDNHLRSLNGSVFGPLRSLIILKLDDNELQEVPSIILEGLESLRVLMLEGNGIARLRSGAFAAASLLSVLSASRNRITAIEEDAFGSLPHLKTLDLSHNKLSFVKGEAFRGLEGLEELDFSNNFFQEVPAEALKQLTSLQVLKLSDNRIQNLGGIVALGPRHSLRHLDLTRNDIGELPPRTFMQLSGMKVLKLAINSIRNVDPETFQGLSSLETLDLDDDNILNLLPNALASVSTLKELSLSYNRIAAISLSFEHIQGLQVLTMTHNVIKDIPEYTFQNVTQLEELNLYGNHLRMFNPVILKNVRNKIRKLNLGLNNLSTLPEFNFSNLEELIISRNSISQISSSAFMFIPELKFLDMSGNMIVELPINVFYPLSKLVNLDLSENQLTEIRGGQFNESGIEVINLRGNKISRVHSQAFQNVILLHTVDLSENNLEKLEAYSFYNTPSVHICKLNDNLLKSFDADVFGMTDSITSTNLRNLDLMNNNISELTQDTFQIHSKLRWLSLGNNNLSHFPPLVIQDQTKLEYLNLEGNQIEMVDHTVFANAPYLRELSLRKNRISLIKGRAFRNSTQLQDLDLSHNLIESFPENAFHGVSRLNLDASYNALSKLPTNLFSRRYLDKLISVDLSHNQFSSVPLRALAEQAFILWKLNLANNMIVDIGLDPSSILVNVKNLDISYNPLSTDAVIQILNEPKIVKYLNLAGTDIRNIPKIEARHLLHLNLSNNNIAKITEASFEYLSLLESLDLSNNRIDSLHSGLSKIWSKVRNLQELDISSNTFTHVDLPDFFYLDQLKVLKMNDLPQLVRIERSAFNPLKALEELELHSFAKLQILDVRGLLENLPGLKSVDIELKDKEVHDQLHPSFHPRLRRLTLRGPSVDALSGGAFAGINSNAIDIGLINTSVTNIRSNLFIPVPVSSKINIRINDSNFTGLGRDLIKLLRSHQRSLTLAGIETNPLYCDCKSIFLRDWLLSKDKSDPSYYATCAGPADLKGEVLTALQEPDLTCKGRPTTTTTDPPQFSTTKRRPTTDNIITIYDVTRRPEFTEENEITLESTKSRPENMDIIIISVVGIVVGLLVLLILIAVICVICVRSNSQYKGGPMAGPLALRNQGNCTCLKPPPPMMAPMHGYPPPPGSYLGMPHMGSHSGTLKMMPTHGACSTMGAQSTRSMHSESMAYHMGGDEN